MKTIGLVGGTGWISSAEYYRIINEEVNRRCGGLQFARCILYSLNYGDIHSLNQKKDRLGVQALVLDAAKRVVSSGADCLLICANTLHQFADEIETAIQVPLIHIAHAVARELKIQGYKAVGLLGTKQTMEMDFYTKTLQQHHVEVLIPKLEERGFIQYCIEDELLKGLFLESSRERFISIIEALHAQGAEAIVLGCTEIPLLVQQKHTRIPLLNTLDIHARAAVDFALQKE
jgi:aspartate racemase